MRERHRLTRVAIALLFVAVRLAAEGNGRIEGSVRVPDGTGIHGIAGLGGVTVELAGTGRTEVTGREGHFTFERVPPGTYALTLTFGAETGREEGVGVRAGETTTVTLNPDWKIHFAETVTVFSAARRQERIVEAPAAITTLSEQEIQLEAAPGQVPKLLEFTVGAQVTQSGLYDFNLNTRGFNNTLNRRIQTLIDGRDPAIPFVASQEWAAMSALADDLASVELLRGPSAALYGENTFNGVLNLVTKAPRDSPGGKLRLSAGELGSTGGDLRWASGLGDGWYLKLLGGHAQSDDFTRSRDRSVEYPGLSREAVPLAKKGTRIDSGALRLDKYLENGQLYTLEGGREDIAGETFLTAAGRTNTLDARREWARFNLNSRHFNLLAYHNSRFGEQVILSGGTDSTLDDRNDCIELQGNADLPGGHGRVVGGASYLKESSDSANGRGVQTLFAAPIEFHSRALFGQLDADLSTRLKLVLALRWDDSTLHRPQLSPKGSLVFTLTPRHTLRLGYNEAFQIGNLAQFFVRVPAGPPLDLSAVEAQLAPLLGTSSLGLGAVPIFAIGNPGLKVEKVKSLEAGYSGILGDHAFLSATYYYNRSQDFVTDLLPAVNSAFPAYRAPAGLDPRAAAQIEQTLLSILPGLTNDPATGAPLYVLSYGNTGRVDTQGLETAFTYELRRWLLDLTYTWFAFDVKEQTPGIQVSPNGPRHSASTGVTYRQDRFTAALRWRWVNAFEWVSGIYAGPVPSYQVASLSASYALSARWQVGLNVSNLFDQRHYEAFGGDLLRRRALGYVAVSW